MLRRRFLLTSLLSLLAFTQARADLTINTDTTVDGGTLNVSAPGILLINGLAGPTLTLTGGAVTNGTLATVVGGTNSGQLVIAGGSMLFNHNSWGGWTLGTIAGEQIYGGRGYVGLYAGSNGTATIDGPGSHWWGGTEVGWSGTGALNVINSGQLSGYVSLGYNATGHGMATIDGPGSLLEGNVFVGSSGTGALIVTGGARVISGISDLGYNSTGVGTATITGANSLWSVEEELNIGVHGTATLNITGGGQVHSGYSRLGQATNGFGTATIDGPGSLWTTTAGFVVGWYGTGTLYVTGGGRADSFHGSIGYGSSGVGTATISGVGSQWTVTNNFYIGSDPLSSSGTGTLNVADGGALQVGGLLKLGEAGTLALNGGNVTTNSLDRSLGTLDHDGGTLTVSGGTYTHASGSGTGGNIFIVNGNTPSAVPTFELTHGATTVGVEATVIGSTGQGQLLISGGSTLTNTAEGLWVFLGNVAGLTTSQGSGYLGVAAGSTGTATVSGAGSQWNLDHLLSVGHSGTGVLNIQDAGTVKQFLSGFLGWEATGHGTATVSGTGSQWLGHNMYVGLHGTGVLNIQDGGTVDNSGRPFEGFSIGGGGFLGGRESSHGTVNVSGAGSQWLVEAYVIVGIDGTGVLNIQDGGTVQGGWGGGILGLNSTSHGTVIVSGLQSLFSGDLKVGYGVGATGVLNIQDGGTVHGRFASYVGNDGFSHGMATISGSGSLWSITGDEYGLLGVGSLGTGVLNILDGGAVVSRIGYLGAETGANGSANVSGLGSTWTVTGNLHVGGHNDSWGGASNRGMGTVTVADDGAIQVGGLLKIWEAGTLNLLAGGTVSTGTLDARLGTLNFAGGTLVVQNGLLYDDGFTLDVTHGTLINNGTIDASVVVGAGGVLKGTGSFADVTINAGGTLSPGNSVEDLDFVNLTLNSSTIDPSITIFEFRHAAGTLPGNDWDFIDIAGTLTINATVDAPMLLKIAPWQDDNLAFGANDFDPIVDYRWKWMDFGNLVLTGDGEIDQRFLIVDDAYGAGVFGDGNPYGRPDLLSNFFVSRDGNSLFINYAANYSAIPEPGSCAFVGLAVAGYCLRQRRRKAASGTDHTEPVSEQESG